MRRLDLIKEISAIIVLALQVKNPFARVQILNHKMDELCDKLNLQQ